VDPPVFIGFGSMPSADPSADLKLMTQAARQAGCRAVIRPSYGWCAPGDSPQDVYLLREAPYRWLFPQPLSSTTVAPAPPCWISNGFTKCRRGLRR
jgi:hypothetical protein